MNLDFIEDLDLRNRIQDSLNYVLILYRDATSHGREDVYSRETFRVLILYIVSIIEVLLFYTMKKKDHKIFFYDYKDIFVLPKEYTKDTLVLTLKNQKEKINSTIGLKELVDFYGNKNVLKKKSCFL
jgi:hypothetical protein